MSELQSGDTYPQPDHGWTCFHCGETFTKLGAARDHFGTTPASTPGCIIKAGDERGLLMALRKAEDARDEALSQRDEVQNQVDAAYACKQAVLQLVPGAKSSHDVWAHLETVTGRAHAAEAVLQELERLAPELVMQARVTVCGPGTYYPLSQLPPLPGVRR